MDFELVSDEQFFAPVAADAVDGLVSQYQRSRQQIEQVADIASGDLGSVIQYFIDGNCPDTRIGAGLLADKLFGRDGAIAALNASFWDRTLRMTDVLDIMPQARRDEWYEQIRARTTPDYTEETVRATLADLLAARGRFFAERVDGIFRALSGEHVTNRPEAFGKRMIVAYMLNDLGSVDYLRAGYLSDLRAVIARFMGRDEPKHSSGTAVLESIKHGGQWGEWVSIDGHALRIRLYKKGTVHIEVHPDMAWRLNSVLASLHPAAIPAKFRTKPPRQPNRDFQPIQRPLPFAVIEILASMQPAQFKTQDWSERWSKLRNTLAFKYMTDVQKASRSEAEQVIASIGGVLQKEGHWSFDYDPGPVIDEIVQTGCIPDRRSHQFYPTPPRLAAIAVDLAQVATGHSVLEPSAGTGGIADMLIDKGIQCVEISGLHCIVLQAKGHNVTQADFLGCGFNSAFDRIVMNPPFDQGRWQAHIDHAGRALKPGGRMVAILPASAKGREPHQGWRIEWHGPYRNEFPGTSVSVVIMVADKPETLSGCLGGPFAS